MDETAQRLPEPSRDKPSSDADSVRARTEPDSLPPAKGSSPGDVPPAWPAQFIRAAILGQMSGSIVHEISQPLAAILGDAEAAVRLIDAQVEISTVRDILIDVIASVLRADEIIKRTRAMLRDGEVSSEPIDLNAVVLNVLRLMRNTLGTLGVTVERDLDERLAAAEADRIQIEQVLLNLVTNACDAMKDTTPGNRVLRITTRRGVVHGEIELSVADTGIGLAREDCERVFQPFVTGKPDGLGLGLAISRAIVSAHGGRVWAEPCERGAMLRMSLRAARPATTGAADATQNVATRKSRAPP